MSECSHDCSTCSANCSSRKQTKEDFLVKPHKKSNIKKVIGVVSGKGGVGKSLVTSLLASNMKKAGYNVGILDADITGPSIPKIFGVSGSVYATKEGAYPKKSEGGVDIMSINLLLEDDTKPVVWRGPVIAGAVGQFWTDIIWEDVDYMFVDMPPGTGDVPLTVFQTIPVDGIVIVTSPQELVSMIVEKAVNMAEMMNINVLGLVENMSYIECPNCHEKISVFGESHVDEVAKKYGLEVLANIPIDPEIAKKCDEGKIEQLDKQYVDKAVEKLKNL
ncbi:Mrp/NBP35 family ATP-binding protein [Anaerofustis sp. NSJ-163]|uniref:Mrp/NBP35 family ATP-binding protein n=1 Tax=Anaerofustis sp. NSJ-163 TaxID=2944391 RepID=UPI00209C5347|nr:Mrp/NBP35 family ATP-binding protein [Anaerofustis sp. NSJ-163]MCO8193999.1 Mrp/NBP35 family ATP-binding protein [Anaerofustis sp. NSJ-163]